MADPSPAGDIAARALLAQEVADIGTWDWDIEVGITNCSKTYFRLYGLPEGRHAPSHDEWLQLIHPEDRELVDARLRAAIEEKKPYDTEFRVVWPDGAIRWLSGRGKVLFDEQGRAHRMLGVNIDITEHKVAEQLRHENDFLIRCNEDLQQFAAAAAHDLQEPLRTAQSFSKLLIQRLMNRLDAKEREYAAFVQNGLERMAKLIDDLLQHARSGVIEPSRLKPTSMAECVHTAIENLAAAIHETGAVITTEPLPDLTVERTLIVILLQNLISNAIKYRLPEERPRIRISATARDNQEWLFAVADNGRGFDPSQASRIFLPLKRLGYSGPAGTGLGLATCQKIVESHKGKIWAEAKPGGGATFYFTLHEAL